MTRSEAHLCDNIQLMRTLASKSVPLGIVDPPYFTGPEKKLFYGAKNSSIGVKRYYQPSADWELPTEEYFAELERVCEKYIVWGCNYFDHKFHTGRIVWDKCNDSSDYSDCEIAATNLFDHTRILRFMWNGMLQGSISDGRKMNGNKKYNEKRIHPTQKPVQLYKMMVTRFAPDVNLILDTHLGSGSSRIAAHDLGIDFVSCEKDPIHFNNQEKRFNQHKIQLQLF